MITASVYDLTDLEQRMAGIQAAARFARRGRLVVFPVDHGYGIGTDAFSREGVAALLRAKDRGRGAPVPLLIPRVETLEGLAAVGQTALAFAKTFWPGPLILLAKPQPSLAWDLGAADPSAAIAVRMPLHPVALALLRLVGPMAVLSVDLAALPQDASVVLTGGQIMSGTSTVLDVSQSTADVVRLGDISLAQLQAVNPSVTHHRPLD